MYIYKKNRRKSGKRKSYIKTISIIFRTIPTVFFALFLILTVTILTGMCAIFPKKKVKVYDGDEKVGVVHILNENVDDCLNGFLSENNLDVIKENDLYELNQIKDGEFEIKIKRGFPLDVSVFGETKTVDVNSNFTVGDVLNLLNIEKDDNITVTPDIDDLVDADTKIEVIKTEKQVTNLKRQEIPYNVKQVFDDSMPEGKTVVKQEGINGVKEVYQENLYNDGKLIKVENKENIIQPGREKIVVVGKKKDNKTKNAKDANKDANKKVDVVKNKASQPKPKKAEPAHKNPNKTHNEAENENFKKNSKKVLKGVATAYLAKGNTARMGPARPGVVAADPKVLPYGTRVYITGYGPAVVGDKCGAACRGTVLVDVCLKTSAQCRAWGRKPVTVYVLK